MSKARYSIELSAPEASRDDVLRLGEYLPEYSVARFRKLYLDNPLGPPALCLARDESGRSVGMGAIFPTRLVVGGETVSGGIAGDFSIEPDHRGFGPALQLERALLDASAESLSFVYGTPNEASQQIIKRVGYHDLGRLTQFVKLLSIEIAIAHFTRRTRLSRVVARVADPLLLLISRERRHRRPSHLAASYPPSFDRRFAPLLESRFASGIVSGERTVESLNWKFELPSDLPGSAAYSLVAISAGHEIVAYAVSSVRNNIRHIADIGFASEEALDALLAQIAVDARRERISGIAVRYFGAEGKLTAGLRSFGFIGRHDTLRLMVHADPETTFGALLLDASHWTFLAGDMDL